MTPFSHGCADLGLRAVRINSIDGMRSIWYIPSMAWEIEGTDEFAAWFEALSPAEKEDVVASVDLLESRGPYLGFPHTSGIRGSRHSHMRELRIQHAGRPYRVLYAFDPRRAAILLLGGDKTGDDRWDDTYVPLADDLYDVHLILLQREGLI
ncbi:MAG TPA: type II toxin-antitoxin system RelE/ParE family toxin [Longimicrobium sp.]|jgi:hypothetical protein